MMIEKMTDRESTGAKGILAETKIDKEQMNTGLFVYIWC